MMLWKCCTQYTSKFGKLHSHCVIKRSTSLSSQGTPTHLYLHSFCILLSGHRGFSCSTQTFHKLFPMNLMFFKISSILNIKTIQFSTNSRSSFILFFHKFLKIIILRNLYFSDFISLICISLFVFLWFPFPSKYILGYGLNCISLTTSPKFTYWMP